MHAPHSNANVVASPSVIHSHSALGSRCSLLLDSLPAVPLMTHTPRILVVDDDQPILLLMQNILREFGFEPEVASTGSAALRQAATNAPELILLDMSMPEMSGAEFIQKLRSDPAMAGIPVLILSGHPVTSSELDRIGADGAIQKPFDLSELLRRIREHLGSHQTGSI